MPSRRAAHQEPINEIIPHHEQEERKGEATEETNQPVPILDQDAESSSSVELINEDRLFGEFSTMGLEQLKATILSLTDTTDHIKNRKTFKSSIPPGLFNRFWQEKDLSEQEIYQIRAAVHKKSLKKETEIQYSQ